MSTADLILRLRADADQAVREMNRVEGATDKIGAVGKAAALAAGAAVTAMAARSITAFADFDTGMREVFTLMPGISAEAMGAMTEDVRAFGQEFGLTTEQTVPALYQAISAGVPADNVFTFMETAAQTARGGVTDLETAVDGLTSVVNAYGADVLSAGEASDVMFTAVRLGKTTIEELAGSVFQVVPIAAAAGITFGQVAAALSAMTASGVPTRIAATNLRGALVELGKEGTVAFAKFEQAAGQTFPDFIASGGDLGQAFDLLAADAEASGSDIQNSFGSVEAGMAATVLASEAGAERFGSFLGEMEDSAGATADAFGMMAESAGFSMDQMKVAVEDLKLSVGEMVMPVVQDLVGGVAVIVDWFKDLPGPVRTAATAIGGVAIALTAVTAHPIVAGLAIIGAAIAYIGDRAGDANAELEEMRQIHAAWLDQVALTADLIAADDIAGQIDLIKGKLEQSGQYGAFRQAGIDMEEFRLALIGGNEAYEAWIDSNWEALQAMADLSGGTNSAIGDIYGMFFAGQQLADQERDAAAATGDLAAAAAAAAGPERDLAAALHGTAVAATAVWEAEQTLANLRRAALDPVYAALQAEADLITTTAEVNRLQAAGETTTDAYTKALIDQAMAQIDLDAAHGKMKASTGVTLAAVVSLGEKLEWTAEQTQAVTGFITEFNESTPSEFNAETAVQNLSDQLGIAYTEALDLALALGVIDGETYEFLIVGHYRPPNAPDDWMPPSTVWRPGQDPDELAAGGHVTRGGLVTVGEAGAETVSLPTGSTVYPHGSAGVNVTVFVAGSLLTEQALADTVEDSLTQAIRRGGSSLLLTGGN